MPTNGIVDKKEVTMCSSPLTIDGLFKWMKRHIGFQDLNVTTCWGSNVMIDMVSLSKDCNVRYSTLRYIRCIYVRSYALVYGVFRLDIMVLQVLKRCGHSLDLNS